MVLKLLFAGDLQAALPVGGGRNKKTSQNRYSLAFNFNLFLPVVFFQSAPKVTCSGCSLSPSICVFAPSLLFVWFFFQRLFFIPHFAM